MKSCPHCGSEYPDEAEVCPEDGSLLPLDEERTNVDRVVSGRLHGLLSGPAQVTPAPEPLFMKKARHPVPLEAEVATAVAIPPTWPEEASQTDDDLDNQPTGVHEVPLLDELHDGEDLLPPAEISHVTVRKPVAPSLLAQLKESSAEDLASSADDAGDELAGDFHEASTGQRLMPAEDDWDLDAAESDAATNEVELPPAPPPAPRPPRVDARTAPTEEQASIKQAEAPPAKLETVEASDGPWPFPPLHRTTSRSCIRPRSTAHQCVATSRIQS